MVFHVNAVDFHIKLARHTNNECGQCPSFEKRSRPSPVLLPKELSTPSIAQCRGFPPVVPGIQFQGRPMNEKIRVDVMVLTMIRDDGRDKVSDSFRSLLGMLSVAITFSLSL